MSGLFRFYGSVESLSVEAWQLLGTRAASGDELRAGQVRELIAEVRRDGDAALRRQALAFDGVRCTALEVPRRAWDQARDALPPALRSALERAAGNIRAVHEAFRPAPVRAQSPDGVIITRRPDPLDHVGVYAPGGRAAYPSSLLMAVVPARVAGVREVCACSPAASDGAPNPLVLAAASIAGADRVFTAGGAGAIAAMAYGTEAIPPVQCIVGPGNAWVSEAKRQVSREVRIDAPAGPSELLVVADESASAAGIARELAAQAEHDPDAAVALVTTAPSLARSVDAELLELLALAPRAACIREALARRGACLTAPSLEAAARCATAFAAEHVLLACRNPREVAAGIGNSGAVFLGQSSSVVFGDYLAGSNHVLPTGGAGRSWSGLSTADFVRWTTLVESPPEVAALLSADTRILALAEGLPAHAEAAAAVLAS
jgi:histidinol dehydrogenase